jgi:hypothetical protein
VIVTATLLVNTTTGGGAGAGVGVAAVVVVDAAAGELDEHAALASAATQTALAIPHLMLVIDMLLLCALTG